LDLGVRESERLSKTLIFIPIRSFQDLTLVRSML